MTAETVAASGSRSAQESPVAQVGHTLNSSKCTPSTDAPAVWTKRDHILGHQTYSANKKKTTVELNEKLVSGRT